MYLMYYLNENGKRVYTLKVSVFTKKNNYIIQKINIFLKIETKPKWITNIFCTPCKIFTGR